MSNTLTTKKLPDFIIPGFAKCGTTSLYYNLKKHPQLSLAPMDEVYFFDKHWDRGLEWYQDLFQEGVSGEKSPNYLFSYAAMTRMAQTVPGVKLIIALRNPVDRAFSHYQQSVLRKKRLNPENTPFESLLDQNTKILYPGDAGETSLYDIYIRRGFYIEYLTKNVMPFFSKDQILFIFQEEMWKDPSREINRIFSFLGVDPFEASWEKVLLGKYRDQGIHLEGRVRRRLTSLYKPHNEALFDYLGRRMDGWD